MAHSEPLTRQLGKAERTLQALLQSKLRVAGITFPEWAVLSFLGGAWPLKHGQLVGAISKGRVVEPEFADHVIDSMIDRGLVDATNDGLVLSESGRGTYEPLRAAVMKITAELEYGIPEQDLAAARRTLQIVAERAGDLLADEDSGTRIA